MNKLKSSVKEKQNQEILCLLKKDPQLYAILLPKEDDRIFIEIYFEYGRMNETLHNQGIIHLTEHYIAGQFFPYQNQDFYTNAYINDNRSWFEFVGKRKNLEADGDIFFKKIFTPNFNNPAALKFEQQSIELELLRSCKSLSQQGDLLINSLIFKSSPFQKTYCRETTNSRKFTLKEIEEHFYQSYGINNCKIFVGLNDPTKKELSIIEKLVDKYSTNLKQITNDQFDIGLIKPRRFRIKSPIYYPFNFVSITYPLPGYYDLSAKEKFALNFFAPQIKTANVGCLEEFRSFGIYGIDYDYSLYQKSGFFTYGFICPKKSTSKALKIFNHKLNEFETFDFEPYLVRQREGYVRQLASTKESNGSFYNEVAGEYISPSSSRQTFEEKYQTFASITSEDIQKFPKTIFKQKNQREVIIRSN